MTAILENYPRSAFDSIEFPFTSRGAKGEFRNHVHEFPKMAGGSVEKLGRKVWTFSFQVPFHTTFETMPDLYPDRLNQLQQRFTDGITAELLVPEIGTIRALITKFDRNRKGATLSGEDVSLEFVEDDLEPFRRITASAPKPQLLVAAATIKDVLNDKRSDLEAQIPGIAGRLDGMLSILDFISSIRDQQSLFGLQVAGQLAQLTRLTRTVHELLKGPDLDPLRRSLRDLWNAARALAADVSGRGEAVILPFVVPATMSVGQIAQRLYRNAARGGEVLALNSRAISDPYQVRAGTRLDVYAA